MALKCPKCDSDRFYFVQQMQEYHTVAAVTENGIELCELSDSYADQNKPGHLWCESCSWKGSASVYTLYMKRKRKKK